MRIIPAVDIRGGHCVNLVQGDYSRETVFSSDPVYQAVQWSDQGAEIVHFVDLDGAKSGKLSIEPQLKVMGEAGIAFQVGGGIRDMQTVEILAGLGAERIILGTAAHNDPDFLKEAVAAFPGRIAVGVDAKNGKVALNGWLDVTDTDPVDFAKRVEDAQVSRIIYTDIMSDGMMKGPNVKATRRVADAVSIPVTASGGVSTLRNLKTLRKLESCGVDEVIIGRALYLGAFTLAEAMAAAGMRSKGEFD